MAEILEKLPADYREVIILRNLEGLSHDEVAKRMGRSPGAIRMLWIRALQELRGRVSVVVVRSALEAFVPREPPAAEGALETGMAR